MESLEVWSTAHTANCMIFGVVEDGKGTGRFIALETADGTAIELPERKQFKLTWEA